MTTKKKNRPLYLRDVGKDNQDAVESLKKLIALIEAGRVESYCVMINVEGKMMHMTDFMDDDLMSWIGAFEGQSHILKTKLFAPLPTQPPRTFA